MGRKTTPNRTDDAAETIIQLRGNQAGQGFASGGVGSPYQLTACPWCGSANEAGRHLETRPFKQGSGRTLAFCGDQTGQCLFSRRQAPDEGLPAVAVDEKIYRRLLMLLIATVDKFAQVPWGAMDKTKQRQRRERSAFDGAGSRARHENIPQVGSG